MAEYMGHEKYVFLGEETTFATATVTPLYAHVNSYAVRAQHQDIDLEEHTGQADVIDDAPGKMNVEGQISGNGYGLGPVPLETFWDWAFTRTNGQLKSLTGNWNGGNDPVQHLGLRIRDFEISAGADQEVVTWSATVVGRDEIILAAANALPDPDPYETASLARAGGPMVFQSASSLFELNDVAFSVQSFRLRIENNLATYFQGRKSALSTDYQVLEQSRPAKRIISGEVTLIPTDITHQARVRGRTRYKLELAVQGYKDALNDRRGVFTIEENMPRGFSLESPLNDFGQITLPFTVRKSGLNQVVSVLWSDILV